MLKENILSEIGWHICNIVNALWKLFIDLIIKRIGEEKYVFSLWENCIV